MNDRRLSVDEWLERLWDWIDKRGVIRRAVLIVAIVQTWLVTEWGMRFAETSTRSGMDFAALIGAVTAPVTAFAGFVFKWYLDSRAEK